MFVTAAKKTRNLVWGEPPKDPKERALLVKIDWFVLSFACLLYWVNYLDRLNFTNAYVLGMQEDIGMKGDDYNLANTCFTVGYIVFMIPHNLIIMKIRPSRWLSFCCFAWGLLTLGTYKVSHVYQLYVLRFFMGCFEGATFIAIHYILGSWYKDYELTKRSAVFTSSGLIGSIFSSTMQLAIYTNMDMKNGIEGWRWLFIIDFCITIPIAIYGFFCFPDTPETCKPFVFTAEELEMAKNRIVNKEEVTRFDWSIIKRVVTNWKWFAFSFLWVLGGENESFCSNSLLALWLKHFDYTIPQRNHYPMGIYAIGIISTFGAALYVDATGARYHYRVGLFIGAVMVMCSIMLIANPLNKHVFFAVQYLAGVSFAGQASFFAYANVLCKDDRELRGIVIASMNMFSNAVNAWWSLLFYAATDVPKWRKGAIAMFATAPASMILMVFIRYMQKREAAIKSPEVSDPESDAASDAKNPANVTVHAIESASS